MPYIEEVCVAGETIEVCKYHSCRWNSKGERRAKRNKETPECQKKINNRIAAKALRRKMNANFTDEEGFLVTLDYKVELRPNDSKEMQMHMRECLKVLRKGMKKEGKQLKYIYVKEMGKRGAAHIHMLMTRCELALLQRAWPYGAVHVDPLYSQGQYAKIAEYFVKYANKTVETEGKLIGKRWNCSRNLIQPVTEKKVIKHVDSYYEKIRRADQKLISSGEYFVEKESMLSGITRDGYGYFTYTLHRAVTNKTRGSGESR